MYEYLLLILAVVVILVLMLLIGLLREHRNLRENYQQLQLQLQRSKDELAALCAAAVAVDKRLLASELHLSRINQSGVSSAPQPVAEALVTVQPASSSTTSAQGYEAVIQKIRTGTGIDALIRDFGLTRDEAVLLNRLHGSDHSN